MKKKNILKLLILVVFIILIICLVVIVNYKEENEIVDGIHTQKDIDSIQDSVDDYLSDKVAPKGLSRLYGKYEGDNDLNDMYRNIYSFVNLLPEISKNVKYDDTSSIQSYYEKNKDEIEDTIGISELSEFEEFIAYLNKSNYNGEKFVECQIDTDTFKSGKKYLSFDLIFTFEDFDNEFKLKLNFSNQSTIKPLVYYSVISDE